jgi:hypothetical protein
MTKKCVVTVAVAFLYVILGMYSQVWAGPPFVTDDPEPVEHKHGEFYVASQYAYDKDGKGGAAPLFEFNYGPLPDVHLHMIMPFTFSHVNGGPTTYGPGDLELGVKYRFIHETDSTPQVGTFPIIEIPTGDSDRNLGAGQVQVLLPIWLQKNWGPWTAYGGAGYWLNRTNPAAGDKNYLQLGGVLQRELSKTMTLGAEVFHFTRKNGDEEHNRTGFNVGTIINLSEDHHILLSAGRDIVGDNRFSAYVAYQLTFGPHEEKK